MAGYLGREARRIARRVVNTLEGIAIAWREEQSFSQWVAANVVNIVAAILVDLTSAERALIIGFGLLVLVAELLNTGIEAAIDRIGTEHHPIAKKAKDTACAAVALLAVTVGVIWIVVLAG